jgi:hypothetical protein
VTVEKAQTYVLAGPVQAAHEEECGLDGLLQSQARGTQQRFRC